MEISFTIRKKQLILGIFASAACFLICYFVSQSPVKSLILAAGFIVPGILQIRISDKYNTFFTFACIVISGAASLFLSQFVQNESLSSLSSGMALKGLYCCILYSSLFYLIIPNLRFSTIAAIGSTLALSTANWFVYRFRGCEFVPIDFTTLGTAANVANKYHFVITANIVYSWILFALVFFGLFCIQLPRVKRKSIHYLASVIFAAVLVFTFSWSTRGNIAIHYGNGGTYYQGYLLNFALSIKELIISPPENYSEESVRQIMEPYREDASVQQTPDILVIMDEAFSDFRVLGDRFNTSEPVSPFIQSLKDNTIHGYALSSSYGGRTANAEFEFLTGSSLNFLPPGTVPYQSHLNKETYSIASALKSRGYRTIAMHPYIASGWARNTVWPNLGFSECYFLEDFPQNDLIRGFVSDQEMMDQILGIMQAHQSEEPLFLFGVTMQNHSGYSYQGPDFTENIFAEGYSQRYPDADQYLTLIRKSDQAIEYLLSQLSNSERETLVIFFGDHLPALNPAFYQEIHGSAFSTLDEQICHYKVPFFVWANYDIPEGAIDCASLNFLSAIAFESAGIELTPYQQFLSDIRDVIPSINMEGYYSKESGGYQTTSQAVGIEKEFLNRYHQIQYAYLFDTPDPAFYGVLPLSQ